MILENTFFSLCKDHDNVWKYRDTKLVATERRKEYFVSEPNYHTTKFFTENVLAIQMRKTQLLTNNPVYQYLSI